MATNKPKSRYLPGATKKLRLPKIGPPKRKGLFEEYFYAFLVIIFAVVAILGIAGGCGSRSSPGSLSNYDAIIKKSRVQQRQRGERKRPNSRR
jgi:hypothetical protein